ncbi:MAG: glycosyltransferase family 4 protein [Scytonematopsis contorta HA4267-MV1]|jgi:glycosyltransferase involved in cell wall biosynthesis|nr:glycosyltransferase family 4 protein [Scytonematopsis contorta HA4267-MV1]
MKILIAAYACIPNEGREEGTGWNCSWQLAQLGHEVWVLTPVENLVEIEKALASNPQPNLHIVPVAHPAWMTGYKRYIPNKLWSILHYMAWQKRAYDAAQLLDNVYEFDVVHHLTIGSLQAASPLWRLKKPFVFGPCGGGQVAPSAFKKYFLKWWGAEVLRTLFLNKLILINPFSRKKFSHIDLALVTNQETADLAKKLGVRRVELVLDNALPENYYPLVPLTRSTSKELRLLWIGKLIPRKALLLVLQALTKVNPSIPFKLTILGSGSLDNYVPEWLKEYGLEEKVECLGHVSWAEVKNAYVSNDVFLFTSLRDSFGVQLLEAMSQALPIITLNHHGARDFVPENAAIKIPVNNPEETITALTQAIENMYQNPEKRLEMGRVGYEFSKTQTWSLKAKDISHLYEKISAPINSRRDVTCNISTSIN